MKIFYLTLRMVPNDTQYKFTQTAFLIEKGMIDKTGTLFKY